MRPCPWAQHNYLLRADSNFIYSRETHPPSKSKLYSLKTFKHIYAKFIVEVSSVMIIHTYLTKRRTPWRNRIPGTRLWIWHRTPLAGPSLLSPLEWSWLAQWSLPESLSLVSPPCWARKTPKIWRQSDWMGCRSGWGNSPWTGQTGSRMPIESNCLENLFVGDNLQHALYLSSPLTLSLSLSLSSWMGHVRTFKCVQPYPFTLPSTFVQHDVFLHILGGNIVVADAYINAAATVHIFSTNGSCRTWCPQPCLV